MPIYQGIYRDGDNPNTHKLHVYRVFCEANSRQDADDIFYSNHGPKWVVAGAQKVLDESTVPEDTVFEVLNPNHDFPLP
jgi:hypothetical protein